MCLNIFQLGAICTLISSDSPFKAAPLYFGANLLVMLAAALRLTGKLVFSMLSLQAFRPQVVSYITDVLREFYLNVKEVGPLFIYIIFFSPVCDECAENFLGLSTLFQTLTPTVTQVGISLWNGRGFVSRSSYEELFGYNDLSDKNREFLMSNCKVASPEEGIFFFWSFI